MRRRNQHARAGALPRVFLAPFVLEFERIAGIYEVTSSAEAWHRAQLV